MHTKQAANKAFVRFTHDDIEYLGSGLPIASHAQQPDDSFADKEVADETTRNGII